MEKTQLLIMMLIPAAGLLFLEVQLGIDLFRLALRPAGEVIKPYLARTCFSYLVIWPTLVIGVNWIGLGNFRALSSAGPLLQALRSPWSTGIVLIALILIAAWLWFILHAPVRLYGTPVVLVPMVVMASICLGFSILYSYLEVMYLLVAPSTVVAGESGAAAMAASVFLVIPLGAIANLVLLMIHVWRRQTFIRRDCDAGPDGTGECR